MHAAAISAGARSMTMARLPKLRVSAMARSLRIAPTKPKAVDASPPPPRKAAVVLRDGMRATEFHRIEGHMDQSNLVRVPIVIVRGQESEVPDLPLRGLIITGSDKVAHPEVSASLRQVVREAANRDIPILALTDSAAEAAGALGRTLEEGHHAGILIRDDVDVLATRIDVRRAIVSMARAA